MKTAICTCIKDEHPYLKEWIDWHLDRGFSHIYLYEDNGSKPHDEIVRLFPESVTLLPIDLVRNEPVTVERRQMQMYVYSMRTLSDKYDWIAFIDADEYVDFEEGWNLERLLKEHDAFPAVMLSWMLYSANGRIAKPDGGVIESYPKADVDVDYKNIWFGAHWCLKSIVNTKNYKGFKNIHWAKDAVNMNGNSTPEYKVFRKAWIRHYYTKSWDEWVWRIMERGDLCNGNRKLAQFFNTNPDMLPMKEKLIRSVAHRIPHGNKCYILDEKYKIIAGGNIHKINELNSRVKNENSGQVYR